MVELRNILEIVSFLCAPVLAYLAFKALRQINESKETRIISSKRDAYKIAADKCEFYMVSIIPLINKLDKSVTENEITFFEKSTVVIDNDQLVVNFSFKNREEIQQVMNLPLDVFNLLESFSLFFSSGIAEENIGYLTIGTTYCNSIKTYLPLIVYLSDGGKYYTNIIKLFRIWNDKLESEELQRKKNLIEREIKGKELIKIKSIGTE